MMERRWSKGSFFFLHYKYTDSCGEDGDFEGKVKHIEEIDRHVPEILALEPDVLIVTGDHSTPAALKGHSWHPVPVVISAETCRRDDVDCFSELACAHGGLGRFDAKHLLPMALAHAGKLAKYGA